jgi:hypothetical protein
VYAASGLTISRALSGVAGSITVQLTNGDQARIKAGDSYDIPPGHDAWVEGQEPYVGIEVQSAQEYAKPRLP